MYRLLASLLLTFAFAGACMHCLLNVCWLHASPWPAARGAWPRQVAHRRHAHWPRPWPGLWGVCVMAAAHNSPVSRAAGRQVSSNVCAGLLSPSGFSPHGGCTYPQLFILQASMAVRRHSHKFQVSGCPHDRMHPKKNLCCEVNCRLHS